MKFDYSVKSVKSLDGLEKGEIYGVCLDYHENPLPMIFEGASQENSYLMFRDVFERENNLRWFAQKDKISFEYAHTNLVNGCCVVFNGDNYVAEVMQSEIIDSHSENQLIKLNKT